jgi:HPt (histidine-containing phosphotransfer) domain-containing protein
VEAIELVKRNNYDLIFMDHMMPEMDGIEATTVIRSLEGECFHNVPIIALTANAVVGMREMFIEHGFNDFISKPVDVSKLDEILDRWITGEKQIKNNKEQITNNNEQLAMSDEQLVINKDTDSSLLIEHCSLPAIPNVDTAKGVAMLRGKLDVYKKVLFMFCKDVDERLPQLQIIPEADTLAAFVIQVHSLKSVSASIGAQEVSSYAAGLEAAGKAADMDFIREHLPDFTVQLVELKKNIHAAITTPGSV